MTLELIEREVSPFPTSRFLDRVGKEMKQADSAAEFRSAVWSVAVTHWMASPPRVNVSLRSLTWKDRVAVAL